jgi:hypothetical protein
VLGALHYGATSSRLIWESRTTNWDSLSFLEFIWHKIARLDTALGEVPTGWKAKSRKVVVLDNYRVHQSRLVKSYLAVLKKVGVVFFYLPPYSPELNLIETEWRQIKYQGLPCRSFAQLEELFQAVDAAMVKRAKAA